MISDKIFEDETPTIAAQQQYLSSRLGRLSRLISDFEPTQDEQTSSNGGGVPVSTGASYVPSLSSFAQPEQEDGPQPEQNGDPGHLLLAPQSKARYVSPAHFAMISQEVSTFIERIHTLLIRTDLRDQRTITKPAALCGES